MGAILIVLAGGSRPSETRWACSMASLTSEETEAGMVFVAPDGSTGPLPVPSSPGSSSSKRTVAVSSSLSSLSGSLSGGRFRSNASPAPQVGPRHRHSLVRPLPRPHHHPAPPSSSRRWSLRSTKQAKVMVQLLKNIQWSTPPRANNSTALYCGYVFKIRSPTNERY